MRWWINQFGNVTGPYSDEQIERMVKTRKLTRVHKISADRQAWIRVDQTSFWGGGASGGPGVEPVNPPGPPPPPPQKEDEKHSSEEEEDEPGPTHRRSRFLHPPIDLPTFAWKWVAAGGAVMCGFVLLLGFWLFAGRNEPSQPEVEGQKVAKPSPPEVGDKGTSAKPLETEGQSGPDFESVKRKVVLMHGKNSSGTGFLLRFGGKKYVVSNEHVIRGESIPEAILIDGTKLRLGALQIARDRDLARYEVDYSGDFFELSEALPNNNDEIWVYGNSKGDDVITTLRGFVTGVGSSVLKVNAEIVGGNSGSPIIGRDGKVLAVAAYGKHGDDGRDWTTKNTQFDDVRRFGVRFTGVSWITVDQTRFFRECARFRAMEVYWDFLIPYLICQDVSKEEYGRLKLVHKDVDRKAFGADDYGFHDMLMDLSKSYAGQERSWAKWQRLGKERNALIDELNRSVKQEEFTLEKAKKILADFDREKIGDGWSKVKDRFRGFNAKRKEALLMAKSFLSECEWQDPMMLNGHPNLGKRGSVEWYREGIQHFLDQNVQKLKDLNRGLRTLEKGEEDDDE